MIDPNDETGQAVVIAEAQWPVTHDEAREAMRRGAPHDALLHRYITEREAAEAQAHRDAATVAAHVQQQLATAIARAEKSEAEAAALRVELAASEEASGMYSERRLAADARADRLERERDALLAQVAAWKTP